MQAEQLLKLLHDPHKITPEDVAALHDLLQLYPYFQAAYALIAKAAYDQDQLSAVQAVQRAAVYATDRTYLRALLKINRLLLCQPRKLRLILQLSKGKR